MACNLVCGGAVLGVLIYFFYIYGYTQPDGKGCRVANEIVDGVIKRVIVPDKEFRAGLHDVVE